MKKKILLIVTIIWMLFIWSNSLQTGVKSSSTSGFFTSILYDICNGLNIKTDVNTLSLIVRKGAHITEFLILEILVFNLFILIFKEKKYLFSYSLLLPFIVAIVDEFIQTFVDGRSGLFTDVLIDSIGIVLGFIIVFLINYFRNKRQHI